MKLGTPFLAVMGVLLGWGLAFSLACRLTGAVTAGQPEDESVVGRFLGASRILFSQRLYVEADNFFHAGVEHIQTAAFEDIFQRTKAVISPQRHKHTEGVEIYEIMPWLEFATTMDPHNVEVYLTTAFWLSEQGKRPDLAEKVLYDAQRNNPGDYRVLLEKAQLFLRENKVDYAARALDAGLKLWPSGLDTADEQVVLEAGRMLTLRAFLYELAGDRDNALKLSKKALRLFPANQLLAQRVKSLEAGEDNRAKLKEYWEQVFPRQTICSREGHDHEHEHEHE